MAEENKNESLKLKLFGPVAAAAGETLQDTWDLVFGGFGNYVEKKRLIRGKALEDFKATLEDKVNEIPIDQLREPPLSIVGSTLDASKYHFEEKKIRDMFASVIAASIDARVSSRVHPSFPTIIQQLSPIDAQTLACFKDSGALPLCEYHIRKIYNENDARHPENASYSVTYTNVFLDNYEIDNLEQSCISITALSRLGLIDISYETVCFDADYTIFEKSAEYLKVLSDCQNNPQWQPHIQKGCAKLTPLGENLCAICFSDPPQSDS